ncbi:PKD domain containing protein [Dactylosporangium vinaceum]|uniref:PKD domain containing protein n=1 Tax=Dactylosporangium vinaceum TaxID=53362 RepID=A0ABV5M9V6_9ACTN|nr:PKD domain containing protein [Dactylosporangium vinaceum]UAB93165.1 PKD domain containing protein [Dactylosporangium vinaceum]
MRRLLALVLLLTAVAGLAGPAAAGFAQPAVVSERPVAWTPDVLNGTVTAIAVLGATVVVGGDFTQLADPSTHRKYNRGYLFAFALGTGRILDATATLDGPVTALATAPDGSGVFVAGKFAKVNGAPRTGLVKLDPTTGAAVPGFTATAGKGQIRSLAAAGPWLYAGGTFTQLGGLPRVGLARLDATTGAADPALDLRLARRNRGLVKVEQVAAQGSAVAFVGAFDTVAGRPRPQIAVADAASAAVTDWSTDAYTGRCNTLYDSYLRGVDIAPDGTWLAVAATGGMAGPTRMCDSAARFDLTGSGNHKPTWVNRTGGNTLWSVAISGTAVYVGGHMQWMDNPKGHKTRGPGATPRSGIAALDPATGTALPWNPGHSRGVGVGVLLTCPAGLLIGSDTDQVAGEYHGRISLLPTA